jgi:hypothetical protein
MNELQEIQGRLRQLASDLWTLGPEKAVLAKDPDTMRRAADLIGELERRRPPTPEDAAMSERKAQLKIKWYVARPMGAYLDNVVDEQGVTVLAPADPDVAASIVALHNASLSPTAAAELDTAAIRERASKVGSNIVLRPNGEQLVRRDVPALCDRVDALEREIAAHTAALARAGAASVEALAAERDRLREALEWLHEAVEAVERHPRPMSDEDVCHDYDQARTHARRTIAALAPREPATPQASPTPAAPAPPESGETREGEVP